MDDLLGAAAAAASRYVASLDDRAVVPSAGALMGLGHAGRQPARGPDRPGRGAGPARSPGRPGHHRLGRRPLLRLRHRRHAARPPSPPAGWPAPGTRTARSRVMSPAARALEEIAAGWVAGAARPAGRLRRRLRHRRHHGQPHGAGRRPPRRCWPARAGTSSADGPLRRAAPHGRGGRGGPRVAPQGARRCSAWAATGWSGCRPTTRAGCGPTRLPALDDRTIVCVQAGNVNTGACDPIGPLSEVARRRRAPGSTSTAPSASGWRASPRPRPGRGRGRGGRLVVDRRAQVAQRVLRQRLRHRAGRRRRCAAPWPRRVPPTSRPAASREPEHHVPEMSRRARGIEVWAALRSLGRSGVADLVDRCCRHASALRRRTSPAPATRC